MGLTRGVKVSDDSQFNTKLMRLLLWSGVVMMISVALVQGFVMHFIPPPSPAMTAEQIASIYADHRISLLAGSAIILCSFTLYSTWVIPIIVFINRMERGVPALTYASMVINGVCAFIVFVIPVIWTLTAYRAGSVSPEITQYSNDLSWFFWVYTFPPYSMWMVIIALAIFNNRSAHAEYPRWLAFYNLFTALLIAPVGLVGFFKSGPLAYNGVIAFWIDASIFFTWMITMTVMTFRAIAQVEHGMQRGWIAQPLSAQS
jgi:hypothetical protein